MENKARQSAKPTITVVDPDFEKAVHEYVDILIEQEKKERQPGLESFEAHAGKMRKQIEDGLHSYQRTYANGYHILLEELRKQVGNDESALAPYHIQEDCRKILEDSHAFMDFLAEGKPLYQLLGFSNEAVRKFYECACKVINESRFEEARDGFFFLTMIAPHLSQCWVGLAYSYLQCHEYDAALLACSRALDLNPDNPDHYLTFVRVFIELKDFKKAVEVCDLGLAHSSDNKGEPWADELAMMMEEAKHQIQTIKAKSTL